MMTVLLTSPSSWVGRASHFFDADQSTPMCEILPEGYQIRFCFSHITAHENDLCSFVDKHFGRLIVDATVSIGN